MYATNITAFTIKNGSASGATLLDLTLPAGWNDVFLPNDGILADNGAYVSALSGTGSVITLLLE